MLRKSGGNQIHGDGWDVHLMKMQSTLVKMFWTAKLMLSWPNMN